MTPPFSLYDDEEDDLNFGLGDLSEALDLGVDASFEAPIDRDLSQEWGMPTPPEMNRSAGLIDSTNEIQLSRIKKLTERALHPDYQLSPGQAFATTVLSILPAAAGYFMGGPELAAKTSQIDGGGAYLKNLQDTDKQERAAAMQAAQLESQNYRQGVGNAQQMATFLMAQNQRQDLQDQRIKAQVGLQDERISTAQAKAAADRERVQQSFQIEGLETPPGKTLPTLNHKMALPLQMEYQELTTAAQDLKRKLLDPGASLDAQRTAYFRMIDKIKKANNYGANFSKFEQVLSAANLPEIGDITSPSSISNTMLAKLREQDPIGKMDEFLAITQREHFAKLKPLGYFPPGSFKAQQQEGRIDTSMYDPLTRNQIEVESGANPNAVSPKGAQGLMQLTEPAIIDVARRIGIDPNKAIELAKTIPEFNVFVGQTYKNMMRERYGDEDKANAAYNAGPGAVDKYGGVPPYAETQDYVAKLRQRRLELLSKKGGAQ